MLACNTTLSPAQKVVGPLAVMFAAGTGFTVTFIPFAILIHPVNPLVTRTVYNPVCVAE